MLKWLATAETDQDYNLIVAISDPEFTDIAPIPRSKPWWPVCASHCPLPPSVRTISHTGSGSRIPAAFVSRNDRSLTAADGMFGRVVPLEFFQQHGFPSPADTVYQEAGHSNTRTHRK